MVARRGFSVILAASLVLTAVFCHRLAAQVGPQPPSADDKAAALIAVRQGNQLLDAGKPEAALAKFRDAHKIVGGNKLYFNFAQAYRAMPGHELEAYQSYQSFLDGAKSAAPAMVVQARTEQAEMAAKLAFVIVISNPPGASCMIDDHPLGDTPTAALPLQPGTHQVVVSKDGYRSNSLPISVTAGESSRRTVVLDRAEAATPAPVPKAVESPVLTVVDRPNVVVAQPTPDQRQKPPVYRRWWFWGGVGAVVLGSVAAILTLSQGGTTQTMYRCPIRAQDESCRSLP